MADAAAMDVSREYRAIGLIGVVHCVSHFYQLALAPLIPFIVLDLGFSYAELGVIITVFYIATAILQTPVGFLVDRIGGRKILVAGLFLNGAALMMAGGTSSFWMLAVYFTLAGVGNSVFHPADYSLLASSVSEQRLGRAFGVHSIGSAIGSASAPVTMVLLASLWDWRVAMISVGLGGMALAVGVLLFGGSLREGNGVEERQAGRESASARGGTNWRFLLSRPMLVFLLYYILTSAANSGIANFGIPAMEVIFGVDRTVASAVLTVFLAAGAVAVLPGGFLADWTKRHDLVLIVAFVVLAACVALVGTGSLPVWAIFGAFIIGGVMRGVVGPTRDILVRQASPKDAVGTAFAFVTTGWMVGNSVTPVLYGMLLDIGAPQAVFYVSAGFTLLAAVSVLFSRERSL